MAAYMLNEYSPTVVGCTYQSAALTKHKFIFKGYKGIAGKLQVFIDEDLYTEIRSGTQMACSACVGRNRFRSYAHVPSPQGYLPWE